jgi:hypothetical protein
MTAPFPYDDMELTHILVVADIERSRDFYVEVLGARSSASTPGRRVSSRRSGRGCCS